MHSRLNTRVHSKDKHKKRKNTEECKKTHRNTKYISLTDGGNLHSQMNIRLHGKHKHKNSLRHRKGTKFASKGSVSTTEKTAHWKVVSI